MTNTGRWGKHPDTIGGTCTCGSGTLCECGYCHTCHRVDFSMVMMRGIKIAATSWDGGTV